MIEYKTSDEIASMREGGALLKGVVKKILPLIKSGTTTLQIDEAADRFIQEAGGEASFKKVKGYRWATCLPVNEQVVHTPPSKRVLKNGDIFTLDIGMFYKGLHTDFADTYIIGKTDKKYQEFLDTGKQALREAIQVARAGNRLGDISEVIENRVEGAGYFILRELTGHGVGRSLHEDPFVFGYVDRPKEKTIELMPGLVIAIEIIYSMGSREIAYEEGNDWSIIAADRSMTACFEHTVAIREKDTIVLT